MCPLSCEIPVDYGIHRQQHSTDIDAILIRAVLRGGGEGTWIAGSSWKEKNNRKETTVHRVKE